MDHINEEMREDIIQKEVTATYSTIAPHFSQTRRKVPWAEFTNWVEKYVKDSQQILDIGCGNGRLYDSLKSKSIQYTGIDNNPDFIEIAKNSYSGEKNANFLIADLSDPLPFSDGQFDIIFCVATFHHLAGRQTRKNALKEFNRILKPSGYLIMTNWSLWQWTYLKQWFREFTQKISWNDFFISWTMPQGQRFYRYYHSFTKGEMNRLLKPYFVNIEQRYIAKDQTVPWYKAWNLETIAQKTK